MREKIESYSAPDLSGFEKKLAVLHDEMAALREMEKMIKESAKAGADAIKLQTIDADENYLKDSISYSLFKKAWLTKEETSNMFDYARSLGVQPFTTVGDFKTLEWVKRLKPKIYKISSGLISHIPLIKKISSLKETVIISTGTANKRD